MEALKKYLQKMPAGTIDETTELERLLAQYWHQLEGDHGGMEGYKLCGRMEDVSWSPPTITFTIERHGGTVLGSTRAELQHFRVDVEQKTIDCSKFGYRQIRSRQSPVDVGPIASEIARLILNAEQDDRLKWHGDERVSVRIGEIFPHYSAVQQTLTARRKRFRKALTEQLIVEGWKEVRPNFYERAKAS